MKQFIAFLCSLLLLTGVSIAWAQDPIPQLHTVSEGENLTYIAQQYEVTVEELQTINNLTPDSLLYVGQQLIIPGGEGEAIATIYRVQLGDTWQQIADLFNTTQTDLQATNQILNPYTPLATGQTVSLISRTGSAIPRAVTGTPHLVQAGETLWSIAAQYNLSPHILAHENGLDYPAYLIAGDRLRIPSAEPYRHLPGGWLDVQLEPEVLQVGQTAVLYLNYQGNGTPTGQLGEMELQFTNYLSGHVAFVGIDAFTPAQTVNLWLEGIGNQPWYPVRYDVQLAPANYATQSIFLPEELNALLDPNVRDNEEAKMAPYFTFFTPERLWDGVFTAPVTNTIITAPYGDARSYNDNPVYSYHTGNDFGAESGTPILATANGIVRFAEPLEIRGQTIIIDHGWGVMSSYSHLSSIQVRVGERVTAGQPIGTMGSTGLSNGPHLHWEIRIHNVPVDGQAWLQQNWLASVKP